MKIVYLNNIFLCDTISEKSEYSLKFEKGYCIMNIYEKIFARLEELHMLVRHSNDGKLYLYDVIDIKKETSNPIEP